MWWLLRTILMLLVVGMLALALAVGPLFLQDTPILEASAPPSPQDVVATRQLVRDIRAAAGEGQESNTVLRADAAQLNSAIRLGSRFIDGFRGRVTIDASEVLGEISMPVPWWRGQKWLNISGRVPEFEQQFSLSRITVGATDLPPALAIAVARTGANIGIGHRFGDKVLEAATAMKITGDVLAFRIDLDDVGKNGVMRGAFGTLRGREMPVPDVIEAYHQRIREAIEQGTLSETGSLLPYLRFALQAALENSTPETLPNAYTAAVFGLAKACGAKDFAMIVGRLAFDTATAPGKWSTHCNDVTFNGRIDSRRHFITSAALQAASNTGVAVSIGEFKELHDIISGAGGFDFTDLAANLSGIRMSNVLMAAPIDAWPSLLERMSAEQDVIVPFDGIPQIMPEAEFKARFGDVDSPQYKAMLAMIEARIDHLALYRGN
ncbi:hypothetical protein [uncultured Roseobacter sp.]|uniref:hypothetical protein n=1 Tax=uncultured Roseobacter sp. TaxID=114847 RepID=UPI00260906AF|nr:hypothetical protein [uncultured Roseobacter sp.]